MQLCYKLFDSAKNRDDHNCAGLESTGREFRCHLHDEPMTFRRRKELDEHLESHSASERETMSVASLATSCPVCQKVSV